MNDFCAFVGTKNVKRDRAFITIEIIIQAGVFGDEYRGRYAKDVQSGREIVLKQPVEQTYSASKGL